MTQLDKHLIIQLVIYRIEGEDHLNLFLNKKYNETFAVLSTFNFFANYDYFKNQLEDKWGIYLAKDIDLELDKEIRGIVENPVFDHGRPYIDINMPTLNIFINPQLVIDCLDLEEYFHALLEQKEEDLREEILKILNMEELGKPQKDDFIKLLLDEIDEREYKDEIKWFLLSLIKDPIGHVEKFVVLTRKYLPLYQEFKKKYWGLYQEFIKWTEEKLDKEGTNFLEDHLKFMNLEDYHKVYLNFSLLGLLTSYHLGDGNVHLFIGITFKRYVEEEKDKRDIDKHLMIYKVLSDRTRFDIIKMLYEKESYGQEIAQRLGITTATVSYHMDFLFAASLIRLKRKSRRIYYSLNTEQIKSSMNFIKGEFGL